MAHKVKHYQNFGHPGTLAPGWDVLDLMADTEEELNVLIEKATKKFWKLWAKRKTLKSEAMMYKPTGATQPWQDPV